MKVKNKCVSLSTPTEMCQSLWGCFRCCSRLCRRCRMASRYRHFLARKSHCFPPIVFLAVFLMFLLVWLRQFEAETEDEEIVVDSNIFTPCNSTASNSQLVRFFRLSILRSLQKPCLVLPASRCVTFIALLMGRPQMTSYILAHKELTPLSS